LQPEFPNHYGDSRKKRTPSVGIHKICQTLFCNTGTLVTGSQATGETRLVVLRSASTLAELDHDNITLLAAIPAESLG
jgi:hypothetical protein